MRNCHVANQIKEHAHQQSQAGAHEYWLQRAREWFEDSPEQLAETIDDHLDYPAQRELWALKDRIIWAATIGTQPEPETLQQWQAGIWGVISPAIEAKAKELQEAADELKAQEAVA